MATATVQILSGSTNGKPIAVTATSSSSVQTIHTCSSSSYDEVYLEAANITDTDCELTITAGGVVVTTVTLAAKAGLAMILNGVRYTGSVAIGAYADTASAVNISGWVNRVTN